LGVTINRNIVDTNLQEIIALLARTRDEGMIKEFLASILTEKELKDISSRWQLVKLLDQGVSQRKIAADLHLSLCKITRGSKELKKKNSVLKKLINQMDK